MSRAAAWLTLAVSLAIFGLCWISEASNTLLAGRDLSIAHWFAGHRKHLASLSLDASALTAPAVVAGVALVVAVLLWFLRHRRDACLLALATLSAVGVTEVAKKSSVAYVLRRRSIFVQKPKRPSPPDTC